MTLWGNNMENVEELSLCELYNILLAKAVIPKENWPQALHYYDDIDRRPKSSDPKLWLIKCKVGDEKEILANLYHKYFYFKSKFNFNTYSNLNKWNYRKTKWKLPSKFKSFIITPTTFC